MSLDVSPAGETDGGFRLCIIIRHVYVRYTQKR